MRGITPGMDQIPDKDAGLFVNLFYYNPGQKALEFVSSAVNNAMEYRVVKYTNGEWELVKETSKLSQTKRGLNSGKTYKYAVQAKVYGKWTTIGTTSTATVKIK